MRYVLILISALSLFASTLVLGEPTSKPATAKVAAGDVVTVTLYDLVAPNVETIKTTRVSDKGSIDLPLIGQIRAADLTPVELEVLVADTYAKAKIIDKAQVSVRIVDPSTAEPQEDRPAPTTKPTP